MRNPAQIVFRSQDHEPVAPSAQRQEIAQRRAPLNISPPQPQGDADSFGNLRPAIRLLPGGGKFRQTRKRRGFVKGLTARCTTNKMLGPIVQVLPKGE